MSPSPCTGGGEGSPPASMPEQPSQGAEQPPEGTGDRGKSVVDGTASTSKTTDRHETRSVPTSDIPADVLEGLKRESCAAAAHGELGLLTYKASVQGLPCTLLVDSGASTLFMSDGFVRQHRLLTHPTEPVRVVMPDGHDYVSSRCVRAHVKMGPYRDRLEFRIVPLRDDFGADAVLGAQWLHQLNPRIDWRTGTLELKQGDKTVTVRRSASRAEHRCTCPLVSDTAQARNAQGLSPVCSPTAKG